VILGADGSVGQQRADRFVQRPQALRVLLGRGHRDAHPLRRAHQPGNVGGDRRVIVDRRQQFLLHVDDEHGRA
jgi:hypothetical protein